MGNTNTPSVFLAPEGRNNGSKSKKQQNYAPLGLNMGLELGYYPYFAPLGLLKRNSNYLKIKTKHHEKLNFSHSRFYSLSKFTFRSSRLLLS
jgi:hypothetical protein